MINVRTPPPSVDQQKVFLTEIQRTSIHIYDRTQRNALSERLKSEWVSKCLCIYIIYYM